MKSLEEAKNLDPEGIDSEIKERRALMDQLVGQLYPSILWEEIIALRAEYYRKAGKFSYEA